MMIDRTIKEFEENVDRTNSKTKCAGLYGVSPKVIKELYYTHWFWKDTCRCCKCNLVIGVIPTYEG